MKFILSAILISLTSGVCFSQPLSGFFTVGGDNPDFTSPAEAAIQLNLNGVGNAPLDFVIRNGEYVNSFEINAQGSPQALVTFRSESGIAENVTLSSETFADLITLSGAAYIRFVKIKLKVNGNSAYSALEILNASHHIYLDSCIVEGSSGNSSTYAASSIYALSPSSGQNSTHLFISNSFIHQGSYGVCVDMTGNSSDSIVVSNCRFENQYAGGIFMKDLLAPTVENNRVSVSQIGNTGFNGITWDNCDGAGRITGNDIFTLNGGRANYGIELNGSAGLAGNEIIIANNSVEVQNLNSLCYGLAQSNNCTNYRIFHNLFFVSGGNSSGSTAYQTFVFDGSTRFFNNILVSNATSSTNRCVYIANQSGMEFIDYNCYWTLNAGSNFTGYFGGAESDFQSFTSETGELYSLNLDPQLEFIDGRGWRASSESLMNTALLVEDFQTDIDNQLRPDPPCIGANEVNQLSTNLANSILDTWFVYSDGNILRIGGEIQKPEAVYLFDLQGRFVLHSEFNLSSETLVIPVSTLVPGIYLVGISAVGRMSFKKVYIP